MYLARKNVFSVVNQIKFMEELPERIKVMSSRLNEDYTYCFSNHNECSCLKIVYDEWIGYNAWMWKIQDQIDTIQDESRKVHLPWEFHL